MTLASSLLIFAGSLQAFLGIASAQEPLFLLIDIIPAYGRHINSELEQTLIKLSSSVARPFAKLGVRFSRNKRREVIIYG
jgi:hypothetical protein